MREHLKKLGKLSLTAILWVFILSIRVDGRTLFSHANEVLVQNSIVRAIDGELANLWYRITETAKVTFDKVTKREDKA
jgi:hypothetical protein